jgi:hypothetical protein
VNIRLDDQVRVGLRRRRDRTHVEDRTDLGRVSLQELGELLGEHERRQLALADVSTLFRLRSTVADNQVGLAPVLQARDQIRSDKSGTAGNYNHSLVATITL